MTKRKLARHILNKRKFLATPDKYPQGRFKDKPCRYCGIEFSPVSPSHLYCSDECAATGISENYYQRTYGISVKDVEQMLKNQNYVCAICKTEGFKMNDSVYSTLNIDHCHKTKDVRGALCHNCNRALGLFQDSITYLESAIQYLKGATTI